MTTDFESLNDFMAAGAARAVEISADSQITLDYSLDSIQVVEKQLALLHDALPKGFFAKLKNKGPSEAEIDLMAMTFGAYIGEVLRRHYGGNWSDENTMQSDVKIPTLHLPDGGEIWPHVKVNKRLRLGADENVWHYAQMVIGQLGGGASPAAGV